MKQNDLQNGSLLLLLGIAASFGVLRAEDEEPKGEAVDTYRFHLEAGRRYFYKEKNAFRALHEFRRALETNPSGYEAFRGMGAAFFSLKKDYRRAAFYYLESLRHSPEDAISHHFLASSYASLRNSLLAYRHFREALKGLSPSEHAQNVKVAKDEVARLEKENPGIGKLLEEALAKPGAPAEVVLEYAAGMYSDITMRDARAVRVGEKLRTDLVLVQAYDAKGIPVQARTSWSVSDGLVLKSADPLAISGGVKASPEEWIQLKEVETGLTAGLSVSVLGPPARIEVVPAEARVRSADRLHLEADPRDEAGNFVYVDRLFWRLSLDGKPLEGFLAREESLVTEENFFEPHRNIFAVPKGKLPRGTLGLEVSVLPQAEAGALGRAEILVDDKAKKVSWSKGKVPHEDSFESALRAAPAPNRMILLEFSALW